VKLTAYGSDVAENKNTFGTGKPGYVQPDLCAGCGSDDRMSIPRLADGRKYWVCDHCGYAHESDETQGTASGTSAYANPFKIGDFVREPGESAAYRVTEVFRSSKRGHGNFKAVLVVDGLKYHRLGKEIFADASRYTKDDSATLVERFGSRFQPDFGA
jgi:hypothetical protein